MAYPYKYPSGLNPYLPSKAQRPWEITLAMWALGFMLALMLVEFIFSIVVETLALKLHLGIFDRVMQFLTARILDEGILTWIDADWLGPTLIAVEILVTGVCGYLLRDFIFQLPTIGPTFKMFKNLVKDYPVATWFINTLILAALTTLFVFTCPAFALPMIGVWVRTTVQILPLRQWSKNVVNFFRGLFGLPIKQQRLIEENNAIEMTSIKPAAQSTVTKETTTAAPKSALMAHMQTKLTVMPTSVNLSANGESKVSFANQTDLKRCEQVLNSEYGIKSCEKTEDLSLILPKAALAQFEKFCKQYPGVEQPNAVVQQNIAKNYNVQPKMIDGNWLEKGCKLYFNTQEECDHCATTLFADANVTKGYVPYSASGSNHGHLIVLPEHSLETLNTLCATQVKETSVISEERLSASQLTTIAAAAA